MVLERDFTYNGLEYRVFSDGRIMGLSRGKFLKTRINEDGYEEVTLGNMKKRKSGVRVHRIVAMMFVHNDDPENKREVNHKDFDRSNNDYKNLEWVTHRENIAYSVANGNYSNGCRVGEKNGRSRLTESDVILIRKMLAENVRISDIAKQFKVGWSTIQHIKLGNTWKGVH